MSDVKFLIGDQADLNDLVKADGQFIVSENNNQFNAYIDYTDSGNVKRKQIGGKEAVLTLDEFNALTQEEQEDGTTYYVWDTPPFESNLAPVEGSTASAAYAVGNCFCYNGQLYKATTAIAIGDTIAPYTNCTPTSIIEIIDGYETALDAI